jgi:hypothetical protein
MALPMNFFGGGGEVFVYLFHFCPFFTHILLVVALFFVSFLIHFDEKYSKNQKTIGKTHTRQWI